MQLTNKKDRILILVLVLLVAGGFLVKFVFFGKDGIKATIRQGGKEAVLIDLSKDTEFVLDDSFGGTNTVTVKDGQISVSDANCPDLVCVYTPPASKTGDIIACLPHGLIISIEDQQGETN